MHPDPHHAPAMVIDDARRADDGVVTEMILRLRGALRGEVITPDDRRYDRARAVFLAGVDDRPALIARAVDAADVAAVVRVAATTGVELAIRSGGHSGAGHSTTDGGVMLDLTALTSLEIDPVQRTAWAGTGLTAGVYTRAVARHGLATGFGDAGTVGIGGITLGGGIGLLTRRYGLTIDSLLGAEVVTADGGIRHIDATAHPDLFWAIRGGGGNFGVVTRLRFRLHPVDAVVGGALVLPATPESITRFVATADAAPDGLTTIANITPCPPLPSVAAAQHGRLVVMATFAFVGEPADGWAVIDHFRALAVPLADTVRETAYPELLSTGDVGPRPIVESRSVFLDHLDLTDARAIVDHLGASDAPLRVVQVRVLGGAAARVPVRATAFAHRRRRILATIVSSCDGPDDRPDRRRWVEQLSSTLDHGDRGAYVNFLGDEGPARVRDAYPGWTWERLRVVKGRYDPGNLFRRNHNIPPLRP
jgi:FAD/FMN-containing dehydrogenase